MPRCSISGMAQWVPARTAMPRLSRMVEMSWAWAGPFMVKLKIAPLPGALALHVQPVQPASRAGIVAQVAFMGGDVGHAKPIR
jgi:hypothetical protein